MKLLGQTMWLLLVMYFQLSGRGQTPLELTSWSTMMMALGSAPSMGSSLNTSMLEHWGLLLGKSLNYLLQRCKGTWCLPITFKSVSIKKQNKKITKKWSKKKSSTKNHKKKKKLLNYVMTWSLSGVRRQPSTFHQVQSHEKSELPV